MSSGGQGFPGFDRDLPEVEHDAGGFERRPHPIVVTHADAADGDEQIRSAEPRCDRCLRRVGVVTNERRDAHVCACRARERTERQG